MDRRKKRRQPGFAGSAAQHKAARAGQPRINPGKADPDVRIAADDANALPPQTFPQVSERDIRWVPGQDGALKLQQREQMSERIRFTVEHMNRASRFFRCADKARYERRR